MRTHALSMRVHVRSMCTHTHPNLNPENKSTRTQKLNLAA